MLELRPNCEMCGRDLPPSAEDAMICSFECTYCSADWAMSWRRTNVTDEE